mmetsp:Transcript_29141/g.84251  ORF Transcript_29141/g.84251 Transcript_29141/m.84251 type:complete len:218 (+) Transcript_29141:369-1022(+)
MAAEVCMSCRVVWCVWYGAHAHEEKMSRKHTSLAKPKETHQPYNPKENVCNTHTDTLTHPPTHTAQISRSFKGKCGAAAMLGNKKTRNFFRTQQKPDAHPRSWLPALLLSPGVFGVRGVGVSEVAGVGKGRPSREPLSRSISLSAGASGVDGDLSRSLYALSSISSLLLRLPPCTSFNAHVDPAAAVSAAVVRDGLLMWLPRDDAASTDGGVVVAEA